MVRIINNAGFRSFAIAGLFTTLVLTSSWLCAQDSASVAVPETEVVKPKPVKNTFGSMLIIDNQTVMVNVSKTLEMDIQHRFGTVKNGYPDFWGFFGTSNIRLGASYTVIDKLNVGIGVTRFAVANIPHGVPSQVNGPLWDASLKYSFFTQTKGSYPVSLTYYGNMAYNTKPDPDNEIYRYSSDRLTFFNQLIIARKVTEKFSVQIAPSLSHQNVVNGYFEQLNDSTLKVQPDMEFNHFAIAISARYKLTNVTSVMVNYDQPLTKHVQNNPNPNVSFGLEFNTSSHSFQLFCTNYFYIIPQMNNMYNTNAPFKYTDGEGNTHKGGFFLIGFNITRLWNY